MYYDTAAYFVFTAEQLYYDTATYSVYDSVANLNLSKKAIAIRTAGRINKPKAISMAVF